MAIITNKGHVSRALDFYNKPDIYFSIGKKTPWSEEDRTSATPEAYLIDDYNPPTPSIDSDMIDLIGVKKVERAYLVVPDDEGSLVYRDSRWKIVDKDEALEKGARWVYMSTNLAYNELSIDISYRVIGVVTGVKRKDEIDSSKYVLEPGEIEDTGVTEIIDFRKPIYRETDQREELVIVIEF